MTATTPRSSDTDAAQGLARRSFLGCALAFGVAGPILAACSSGGDTEGGTSGGGDGGSGSGDELKAGTTLVATADVPVGGGVALTDVKIVVTQPTEGEFKAFSAICTHQGSTIDKVEDGDMICPLHGSRFSIKDGSVDNGPATSPVKEISIKVEGDQVVLA